MAYERKEGSIDWLALWIAFSAWSSLSGWGLSAVGWLNPVGIVISYSLFLAGVLLLRDHFQVKGVKAGWRIFCSPHAVPRIWLLLVILAVIGGIAYSPNNYDYLTYRFTRVLNWSWDHAWSWIPTANARINYSGTGFEWLMVPLFVVFKTDRLFFLINVISYLFLPGVVFSVFSRLGISKRISWWWMWVLPCAYCYILEAGSVGNDAFAAVYLLASLHYLLEARTSSPTRNLALSCLAIGLTSGAKASNLPLVLPWLVVLFFQRKSILEKGRPLTIAAAMVAAVAVSFVPMALLNIHYTGDYTGDPANSGKMKLTNPIIGVLGNGLQIATDNLSPPFQPGSINWKPLLPSALKADLAQDFPRLTLRSGELQIEENAGVGLGIVLFASLFLVEGIRARIVNPEIVIDRKQQALWVVGAGAVALLAYMSKMGSEATSRLVAAYYPLLLAGVLVLASLDGRVMHRRVLKWGGLIAMLSALPLVILCPARPLFPVQIVSDFMSGYHISPTILARYQLVYGVYADRSDAFRELTAFIPPGERAIGLLELGDQTEAPLWRPLGSRKVIEVTPVDSPVKMKEQGIHFVVISEEALTTDYHETIASLATAWSASLVVQKSIVLKAHVGPEMWYLLSL